MFPHLLNIEYFRVYFINIRNLKMMRGGRVTKKEKGKTNDIINEK